MAMVQQEPKKASIDRMTCIVTIMLITLCQRRLQSIQDGYTLQRLKPEASCQLARRHHDMAPLAVAGLQRRHIQPATLGYHAISLRHYFLCTCALSDRLQTWSALSMTSPRFKTFPPCASAQILGFIIVICCSISTLSA